MKTDLNIPLKTDNLSIGYPGKLIGENLNLELTSGDFVCLLGQNGVGKSTLLKTLAGLIPSLNGFIQINDEPINSLNKYDLARKLSIVTTEKQSASGLSVLDVLLAGRYPYQKWLSSPSLEDFEKISSAADQTNINYLLDKRLDELSDGQRQKVMIARALVQDGDIILLDEPTAHLDLTNRVEIMSFLMKIAKDQNKTLLVSTHELSLALQFASQLWLMDYGQPVIQGTPEDLAISGDLNRIYHYQNFQYDLITGKINTSNERSAKIKIEASEDLIYWISNALDRIGYSPEKEVTVTAKTSNNLLEWQLIEEGNTYNGRTINELIKQINRGQ